MSERTDSDLLRAYGLEGSQEAFGELVQRYGDMVFSAAYRQVGDRHLAEDVMQAVFLILSQKARATPREALAGWLVTVTRFAAMKARTMRARRRVHEERAAAMKTEPGDGANCERLAAHLDDALARLGARDRDAVVMRYLGRKSLGEVAVSAGISQEAAQKRVARALVKLRGIFTRQGVALADGGAEGLGAMLAGVPVHAAPASLPALAASLIGVTPADATIVSIAQGATQMMMWMKVQVAAAIAACVLVMGGAGALVMQGMAAPATPQRASAPGDSHAAPRAVTALDLSTPMAAFRSMVAMMNANDATAYGRMYAPESPAADDDVAAQQALLTAQARILEVYHNRLDPEDKAPLVLFRFGGLPEMQGMKAVVSRIDDQTADILIPAPYVPRYRVVQTGGQWHIQAGASLASLYPHDRDKALKTLAQGARDMAGLLDVVTQDITNGKLATPEAAAGALKERLKAAMANRRDPLPPAVLFLPTSGIKELKGSAADFKMMQDVSITRSGLPSLLLTSTAGNPLAGGSAYMGIKAPYKEIPLADFLGKRIRYSAWVKTEGVTNWGGLFLLAMSRTANQSEAVDFMNNRALHGTMDWKKAEIVVDITERTTDLNFGVNLVGAGKIWLDDPCIEIVGKGVPTTDDENWQLFSDYAPRYSATTDGQAKRQGRATLKIASGNPAPPADAWCNYVSHNRHADAYAGHTVKLSAWIKSANVAGRAYLNVAGVEGVSISGTTDWTYYEATMAITPGPSRVFLDAGVRLNGTGTIWIDDLKVEIVDK